MSFNKVQDFEKAAEEAERLFLGTPEETTPVAPEVEPVVEEVAPEPTPVTEAAPEPVKPVIDEEKYKAAVKAMNEAQREAAELRKAKEQDAKEKAELAEKLNELARQKREPEPEQDDLETDMPEVARIAERKARQVQLELERKLEDIKKWQAAQEEAQRQREVQSAAAKAYQAVKAAHPDYDELVNSEAMIAYINNEAPPVFKAIFDGSVPSTERDIIAVVSAFKSTLAPKAPARSKPSAADIAAPVRTSPSVNTSAQEERPITEAELNDFMHNAQRKTEAEMQDFNRRLEKFYGKP